MVIDVRASTNEWDEKMRTHLQGRVLGMKRCKLSNPILKKIYKRGVPPVEGIQVPRHVVDRRDEFSSRFLHRCIQRRADIFQLFLERSKPLSVYLKVLVRPLRLVDSIRLSPVRCYPPIPLATPSTVVPRDPSILKQADRVSGIPRSR